MSQVMVNRPILRLLMVFFLVGVTTLIEAMPEDRTQTMQLHSGFADLDQQAHRGIYKGTIEFDQGTTHLRAAEATTIGDEKNHLVEAIIKGNKKAQAHYWTITASDKPPFHAYADTIYYFPDRHLIKLIGNARIEQGKDSFSAPKISYDTMHQHVISTRDDKARTTIIIHPGKNP